MGEQAEYAIQEGMDALDYIVDGEDHELTDQYGNLIDQEPAPRSRRRKTCWSCGAGSLVWGDSTGRWLLHNADGTLHECPVTPLPKEGNA